MEFRDSTSDSDTLTIMITRMITGEVRIRVLPGTEAKFAELIQRGANLWPDAPGYIKEFADIITNGAVIQEYDPIRTSFIFSPNSGESHGN